MLTCCTDFLVDDTPISTALQVDTVGKVVLTKATSPHYLLDIMERRPRALLVNQADDLAHLLKEIQQSPDQFFYRGPPCPTSPLSACERRVFGLMALDLTNVAIAEKLDRKVSTINTQILAIYSKLGVRHRRAAIRAYWGQPVLHAYTSMDGYP